MKQKTYTGKGLLNMLEVCKQYKLSNLNSKLKVKNPEDLDSEWTIVVNSGRRDIP